MPKGIYDSAKRSGNKTENRGKPPSEPRKIKFWNENLTSSQLAEINGVTRASITVHAKKKGLTYKKGLPGKHNYKNVAKPTAQQVEVRELIRRFRRGDDTVIQQLNQFGLRAWRV
jgi:hypothetical protein